MLFEKDFPLESLSAVVCHIRLFNVWHVHTLPPTTNAKCQKWEGKQQIKKTNVWHVLQIGWMWYYYFNLGLKLNILEISLCYCVTCKINSRHIQLDSHKHTPKRSIKPAENMTNQTIISFFFVFLSRSCPQLPRLWKSAGSKALRLGLPPCVYARPSPNSTRTLTTVSTSSNWISRINEVQFIRTHASYS